MVCSGCDEKLYMEYLNEVYGQVSICGLEYPAGDALKEIDPIAFDVGFADTECTCDEEEEDESRI